MLSNRVVVYGCGNVLKGDDGLGPTVANLLNEQGLPEGAAALDIGTSIKQVLFDLIVLDPKPERIIIVDATTQDGKAPGEFWEITVDELHPKRIMDFSSHLFPSVNLLKRISDETSVNVKILAVQTAYIPELLDERLSPEVQASLPAICDTVRSWCLETLAKPKAA